MSSRPEKVLKFKAILRGLEADTSLSIRERFAMEFMAAIIADPEDWGKKDKETCAEATARYSVEFADALLKRLEDTK